MQHSCDFQTLDPYICNILCVAKAPPLLNHLFGQPIVACFLCLVKKVEVPDSMIVFVHDFDCDCVTLPAKLRTWSAYYIVRRMETRSQSLRSLLGDQVPLRHPGMPNITTLSS